jgi:hypothetical protein
VRGVTVWLAALWGAGSLLPAYADPWLAPGDATLRHDLQWLADEGILEAPTTTWPMAREELARSVRAVDDRAAAALPPSLAEALARVRRASEPQSGSASRPVSPVPNPRPCEASRTRPRSPGRPRRQ